MAVADGVSLRAAKFVTGTFIPLVGSALADSMELAAGYPVNQECAGPRSGGRRYYLSASGRKILAVSLFTKLRLFWSSPCGNVFRRLGAGATLMVVFAAAVTGLMSFLTILIGLGNMTVMSARDGIGMRETSALLALILLGAF